jgi:hypothetical protein
MFLEFAGIICKNYLHEGRNIRWHPSLGCGKKETPQNMEDKHHDIAQHISQFWSRLSMQRICQQWSFPHTLVTWLQLVFTCSLNCKQHCRDDTFVMILTLLRMQRSWIVFHKMSSITFTVAGREYRYTTGLFWRKCTLKWLYSFVLLTNRFWNILKLPHTV